MRCGSYSKERMMMMMTKTENGEKRDTTGVKSTKFVTVFAC
jgi:hypothetical protein